MSEIELLQEIAERLFWVNIGLTGILIWLVLIYYKIKRDN